MHATPRILSALGAIALLVAGLPSAAPAAGPVTVTVNGQTANLNPPPTERAGRVFVPLRGVFEQLGATVVYDNGTINATGRGHTVSLKIGSQDAIVDGQQQTVDVAPFIIGASTYVPLRFVSQALGASVNYDGTNNIVAINAFGHGGPGGQGGPPAQIVTPPPAAPAPPPPPAASNVRVVNELPRRDSTIPGNRPTVEASFTGGMADPNAVRVTFDGRNVTDQSYVSPRGFTYTPPSPVPPGPHQVGVTGQDRDGAPFRERWQFTSGSSAGHSEVSYAIRGVRPQAGVTVAHDFPVVGVTAPGAEVTVQVGIAREPENFGRLVGGLFGLNGTNSVQVTVTAGPDGGFRAPISIDAPSGSTLGIVITASDVNAGLSANPVRYTVVLE
ncbi:MAG TPA: copper amine oxidase N-terminal domain-containing protein [Candidatus Elarobacter sp.]|jgi:hypothetical protein|nr:copper amine oxidase N-terminal domain-containing protein [Candidatus Elarobacter sp.]